MTTLLLPGHPQHVLCLGAHPDDIEIGCGGTILRLLRERDGVEITWVVLSGDKTRAAEAEASARHFLKGAKSSEVRLAQFTDSFFPAEFSEIKAYLHQPADEIDPTLVLTHRTDDLHQDHRLVGELAWNTFRDHLVLEFEIPKYDGDLGQPNVFVSLKEDIVEEKIAILMESFPSQATKALFRSELFWSLPTIRGMESKSPSGLAEAFHVRKANLTL